MPVVTSRRLIGALDFGGAKIAAAVLSDDGQKVLRRACSVQRPVDSAKVLDEALDLLRGLADEVGGDIITVGIATLGVPTERGVLHSQNLPGWDQRPLRQLVIQAFGTEAVTIANDVHAAAHLEIELGSLRGVRDGIYLNLGTGISAALVVNGAVVPGGHGSAGEIAFSLRSVDDLDGPDETP